MSDILDFTQEISSRSAYKKLVHKGDDAAAVKSLDSRLTHAFQLFEVPLVSVRNGTLILTEIRRADSIERQSQDSSATVSSPIVRDGLTRM